MTTADRWIADACAELGLDPADVPVRTVLNLARVAAHRVERPAAPLTAFILGLAVGRGADPSDATARLNRLAAGWSASPDPDTGPDQA
jgi:hypothetical protein